MDKLFIKNKGDGQCASIALYQFAKSSRMTFSQFKRFFNNFADDYFRILFKQCEPVVKKYWGKQHSEYPSVNKNKIKKMEVWWSKRFRYICDTEYELIMFTVHALFTIMTGIDIENVFYNLDKKFQKNKELLTSVRINNKAFTNYFNEMLKYTSTIPIFQMEYCVEGSVKHNNHVICLIYNTNNDTLVDLNSNLKAKTIASYNPVVIRYLIKEIWRSGKEPPYDVLIKSGF